MKKIATVALLLAAALTGFTASAQDDKSKRPSPPATLAMNGDDLALTINYSQPSVKGRTIGKDIAPYGKVWRTGANEATTFEVNRDVTIEGQPLKAGKYALFTIPNENEWVVIFNKVPGQWGSNNYDDAQDALRVKVKPTKSSQFHEKMTFANNNGTIALMWGDQQVSFAVK